MERKRGYARAWMLCFATLPGLCAAQQAPIWTQYFYNRMIHNPGFTGYEESLAFTLAGRTQWVGIDGAPRALTLAASKPFAAVRGAAGASMVVDALGPYRNTTFNLHYAYWQRVGNRGARLQLGVNAGLYSTTLDGTNFRPPDQPNDPALLGIVSNQVVPDLGAGAVYLAPEGRFYLGASVLRVLSPQLKEFTQDLGQAEQSRLEREILLTAGYRFTLLSSLFRSVYLTPSALYRQTGGQNQLDINVLAEIQPVSAGLSYRLNDALAATVGLQVSERIFMAYSYDYTLSELAAASNGSHEVVLRYTLPTFLRLSPPNYNTRGKPSF